MDGLVVAKLVSLLFLRTELAEAPNMLRSILKSWKENRGNLLLVLGAVAGLIMSLVWYFDLVPEVSLTARSLPGTLISTAPRSASRSLVGIVRLPVVEEGAPVTRQVIVEVYPPSDAVLQQHPPLLVQSVKLRNDSAPVAVVFNDLPTGKYAAVAYVDLNENGRFDIDESGDISEPFCLARLASPTTSHNPQGTTDATAAENGETSHDVDEEEASELEPMLPGMFKIEGDQATLIVFYFETAELIHALNSVQSGDSIEAGDK